LTRNRAGAAGFTLIEIMIVVGMLATFASFAIPSLTAYIERARIARAIGDIRTMQTELASSDSLPDDMTGIERATMSDPWGNPYVYHKFVVPPGIQGQARKDRFLVPINSQYDLYSMGRDGDSRLPLTPQVSQDDVIRANDGSYIGLAAGY